MPLYPDFATEAVVENSRGKTFNCAIVSETETQIYVFFRRGYRKNAILRKANHKIKKFGRVKLDEWLAGRDDFCN